MPPPPPGYAYGQPATENNDSGKLGLIGGKTIMNDPCVSFRYWLPDVLALI